MTGQYHLSNIACKKIMNILDDEEVEYEPHMRTEDDEGNMKPYHRDVIITVSSYDDEQKEYELYVTID